MIGILWPQFTNFWDIPHSLAFFYYAYYTTCTMQKQDFLLNTNKTLCKKAY